MKQVIFVLAALFAVINCAQQYTTKDVIEKVKSKYLRELLLGMERTIDYEVRSFQRRCPGSPEKLRNAAMEFLICEHQLDESLTICKEIQIVTTNCTKSLIQLAADCVPPEAREMPDLILKSGVSISSYFCQKHGEDFLELANQCFWKNFTNKTTQIRTSTEDKFQKCQEAARKMHLGPQGSENVGSEICSLAVEFRACFENFVELSHCKNQKTNDMALGLYDAFIAPCKRFTKL